MPRTAAKVFGALMKPLLNMVGPRVKKVRQKQGLTQPELAARCVRLGWEVSDSIVSRIECQSRTVADFELLCLAKALRVSPNHLWPS